MGEERKEAERKLFVYFLGVHLAAFFFGLATFFVFDAVAGIAVFISSVMVLVSLVYWRTARNA